MKILLCVILLLSSFIGRGTANSSVETEIIIIGTVHNNISGYNSDTLLNILYKVSPDLILVECDSSYMTSMFDLKDEYKYAFLETTAITNYRNSRSVELRPYDITARDSFLNNYSRRVNKENFFRDIEYLSSNQKLSSNAGLILTKILSVMNTTDEIASGGAMHVNNSESHSKIDTMNYYLYEGINTLIRETPELGSYQSFWEEESNFRIKRNNAMADNIIRFTNSYKGKRIVVLCGLSHKSILKNMLVEKSAEGNFKVKEFWE